MASLLLCCGTNSLPCQANAGLTRRDSRESAALINSPLMEQRQYDSNRGASTMATIIVFPGAQAVHTALALEMRGYRVDPRTGRATRRTEAANYSRDALLINAIRRFRRASRMGGHHGPTA